MFTALTSQLAAVLKRVTGRGVLSEQDVTEALRDIRRHLLEADVSFEVTQGFVERVRERGVAVFGMRDAGSGMGVVELVRDALREAEKARCRTVIVDTAGRLQIDGAMMDELKALRAAVSPREVLLVADGMTGQDAVRIARGFQEGVGLTGVILTKLDGDARGGAALSIHGVTGLPIKFIGTGENVGAQHAAPLLEPFDPLRMAGRILGQGDVVALVEQAAATVDAEAARRLEQKARSKQGMDLADFLVALKQMRRWDRLSR